MDKEIAKWVDIYSDELFAFALKRLLDRDMAKDFVQETFVQAYIKQSQFEKGSSPKAWLYTILRNKIIDHYRKKKTRTTTSLSNIENPELIYFENDSWQKDKSPGNWDNNSLALLERAEFKEALMKCLVKLTEKQRLAFSYKYLEGWNSKKISKELGITSSNYWVLIHRAKLLLRDCLEKNWLLQ